MTVPKEPGKLVLEYDRHHHIHPYTVFDNSTGEGRLLVGAGSGTRIYDDEGNGYVDTAGGMWCTNVGLGNKEMAQAIGDQVQQLA